MVVVPLSTSPLPQPPISISVTFRGAPSVAVVDQIRAVSKGRLDKRMGVLSAAEIKCIEEALLEVLGIA